MSEKKPKWYTGWKIEHYNTKTHFELPNSRGERRFTVYDKNFDEVQLKKIYKLIDICERALNEITNKPEPKSLIDRILNA